MDKGLLKELSDNLTVSVETAGKAFGLGRNSAYSAVRSGQLPSIKLGGKIAVPTAPLRRLLGIDRSTAE